jgi:predicted nucleotidyltransferase
MKQVAIDQEELALDRITAILVRALSGKSCRVYLFGSRAAGTAQPTSDFDVAVLAEEDLRRELSLAREMLEESNIPFKVDVVDLRQTAPAFSAETQAQGILLWKN